MVYLAEKPSLVLAFSVLFRTFATWEKEESPYDTLSKPPSPLWQAMAFWD